MEGSQFSFVKRSVLKFTLESIEENREILSDKIEKVQKELRTMEKSRQEEDMLTCLCSSCADWKDCMKDYLEWIRNELQNELKKRRGQPVEHESECDLEEVELVLRRETTLNRLIDRAKVLFRRRGFDYEEQKARLVEMDRILRADPIIQMFSERPRTRWECVEAALTLKGDRPSPEQLQLSMERTEYLMKILQDMVDDESMRDQIGERHFKLSMSESTSEYHTKVFHELDNQRAFLAKSISELQRMINETFVKEKEEEIIISKLQTAEEFAKQKNVEALAKLSEEQVDDLVTHFQEVAASYGDKTAACHSWSEVMEVHKFEELGLECFADVQSDPENGEKEYFFYYP